MFLYYTANSESQTNKNIHKSIHSLIQRHNNTQITLHGMQAPHVITVLGVYIWFPKDKVLYRNLNPILSGGGGGEGE